MAKDKKKGAPEAAVCLLLNKASSLLARGELESGEDEVPIRIRVPGGDAEKVVAAEVLQVVPTDHQLPTWMAKVILRRGNVLTLEPLRTLGEKVRQNFRMQVDFESFVYPKTGGRETIRALDLSCGGIAMYSAGVFDIGKVYEVVIPITSEGPLILDCEILRSAPYGGPILLYAAKFTDLIDDQETLLREAVFQAQILALQMEKQKRNKAR